MAFLWRSCDDYVAEFGPLVYLEGMEWIALGSIGLYFVGHIALSLRYGYVTF